VKTTNSLILCASIPATSFASTFAELPTEYIARNENGTIKTIGKYTRDSSGRVLRFDVTDAENQPLYTEVPFYADDGRIIRADKLSPDGKLLQVVVYFSDKLIILDASGKFVETQGFSQEGFLRSTGFKSQ
jgi:hypothetical protein